MNYILVEPSSFLPTSLKNYVNQPFAIQPVIQVMGATRPLEGRYATVVSLTINNDYPGIPSTIAGEQLASSAFLSRPLNDRMCLSTLYSNAFECTCWTVECHWSHCVVGTYCRRCIFSVLASRNSVRGSICAVGNCWFCASHSAATARCVALPHHFSV